MRRKKPRNKEIKIPTMDQNTLFRLAQSAGVSMTEFMEDLDYQRQKTEKKMQEEAKIRKANEQERRKIGDMIAMEKPEDLQVIASIIEAYKNGGLNRVVACANEMIVQTEEEQR